MEKKLGYAKRRALEQAGEVEMKDVADFAGKGGTSDKIAREGKSDVDMEVDGAE